MHVYLVCRRARFGDCLDQLHEIADLVKRTHVRVGNRDLLGPCKIGREKCIEGYALLVFRKREVPFLWTVIDREKGRARITGG